MSLPSLVRLLLPKLQARGGVGAVRHQECQRALTQKQTLWGWFEVVAYSSFSIFVSLRTAASLDAPSTPMLLRARLRARDGAGMVSDQKRQRALTQKQTLWSRFEYRAAYDSEVRVELPLILSARAAPPSGPRLLP